VYSAEALETQRRVLGNEHPYTLTSIVNMGGQLMSQGKYDEAQVYLAEALEGFRRVLGNEHPSTLISIVNMGGQLMNQGKYDEAQVYLAEALEGFRRVLGNEHPHTLYSINALVELYDAWEKPEEAKKYRDMLPEEDAATEDSE
jgi:tetratricopeptide (TPR) repeat protein